MSPIAAIATSVVGGNHFGVEVAGSTMYNAFIRSFIFRRAEASLMTLYMDMIGFTVRPFGLAGGV